MKLRYPEMKDRFDHDGFRRGQQREAAQAEREQAERYERKLLREIEEADAKLNVDPPPELSPAERKERELAERLDRLEGKEQAERLIAQGGVRRRPETSEQNRRREAVRLLRIRKAAEEQDRRNKEHEKRCAKQIKALEDRIADTEAKRDTEEDRHREAMAVLRGEHTELKDKLGALVRGLEPDETSEQRLKAVIG